ncbi:hypothetical protein [Puia sp.]|jgi:hypothetical protein|uniref:hypothetical protein n=1 Tax=Puia sp. TaxID=2045100 RepID=UPI002F40E05A
MRKLLLLLPLAGSLSLSSIAQSNATSVSVENSLMDLTAIVAGNTDGRTHAVGSIASFHQKDDTKGSRLLLHDWAKGYVIANNDSILRNDKAGFNYDKISHILYFTPDKQTVVEIEKTAFKGFIFTEPDGEHYFIKVDAIKPDVFFELVGGDGSTAHINAYKLTKTQFKKADYHTDGMVESGNNYDEYVDTKEYYIVMPGGKEVQTVELKKKSIRTALSSQKAKVEEYFSQHKASDINENFLADLISYINKS